MTLISLNQFSVMRSILRPRRYATREQIEAYQNRQLQRVIAHAYEHVPYYRRLFDLHGIAPEQVMTVGDLASLPVTSRKDRQSLPEARHRRARVQAGGIDPTTDKRFFGRAARRPPHVV